MMLLKYTFLFRYIILQISICLFRSYGSGDQRGLWSLSYKRRPVNPSLVQPNTSSVQPNNSSSKECPPSSTVIPLVMTSTLRLILIHPSILILTLTQTLFISNSKNVKTLCKFLFRIIIRITNLTIMHTFYIVLT